MIKIGDYSVSFLPLVWGFTWGEFRLNTGGYLGGTNPYKYWHVGPLFVKKYLRRK